MKKSEIIKAIKNLPVHKLPESFNKRLINKIKKLKPKTK
jgi:hypothetical protein